MPLDRMHVSVSDLELPPTPCSACYCSHNALVNAPFNTLVVSDKTKTVVIVCQSVNTLVLDQSNLGQARNVGHGNVCGLHRAPILLRNDTVGHAIFHQSLKNLPLVGSHHGKFVT